MKRRRSFQSSTKGNGLAERIVIAQDDEPYLDLIEREKWRPGRSKVTSQINDDFTEPPADSLL